jgi:hypothetical protein
MRFRRRRLLAIGNTPPLGPPGEPQTTLLLQIRLDLNLNPALEALEAEPSLTRTQAKSELVGRDCTAERAPANELLQLERKCKTGTPTILLSLSVSAYSNRHNELKRKQTGRVWYLLEMRGPLKKF